MSPQVPTESPTSAPTLSPLQACILKSFVPEDYDVSPLSLPDHAKFAYGVGCSGGSGGVVAGIAPYSSSRSAVHVYSSWQSGFGTYETKTLKYLGQAAESAIVSDDGQTIVAGSPGYVYRTKAVGCLDVVTRKTTGGLSSSTEYGRRAANERLGQRGTTSIDKNTDDTLFPVSSVTRKNHWPTILAGSIGTRKVFVMVTRDSEYNGPWQLAYSTAAEFTEAGAGDDWAAATAVRKHMAVVGAPAHPQGGLTECGKVYLYKRRGGFSIGASLNHERDSNTFAPWSFTPAVENPRHLEEGDCAGDRFGAALAMSQDEECFLVGAPGNGQAYVFCQFYHSAAPYDPHYKLVRAFSGPPSFGSEVALDTFVVGGLRQYVATFTSPATGEVFQSIARGIKVWSNLTKIGGTGSAPITAFCHVGSTLAYTTSDNRVQVHKRVFHELDCQTAETNPEDTFVNNNLIGGSLGGP